MLGDDEKLFYSTSPDTTKKKPTLPKLSQNILLNIVVGQIWSKIWNFGVIHEVQARMSFTEVTFTSFCLYSAYIARD